MHSGSGQIGVFRAFIASVTLVAAAHAGSIIYTDPQAIALTENGTTWCSAFRDLQDALNAAQSGDEIRVADGRYTPAGGTPDRTATFRLRSGVVLLGGYAGCGASNPDDRNWAYNVSILSGDLNGDDGPAFANDGDNSFHVVTYNDPAATGVVLDGFVISGGNADGTGPAPSNQGGGIHIRNGTVKCIPGGPTVRNCVIRDNRAAHHGAVNDHGLASVFENCIFRENFAGEEGAGLLVHSGSATVTNCTFLYNVTVGEGGAVWTGHDTDPSCSGPSESVFTDCFFANNKVHYDAGAPSVTGLGGGAFNELNGSKYYDCVFRNNEAFFRGGGLFANGGAVLVSGCRFEENLSPGDEITLGSGEGGGLWLGSGTPRVTNCTFLGNAANHYGGGLGSVSSPARIENCTFEDNAAGRGGGIRIAGGNPLVVRCHLRSNQAQVQGGGIVVEGNAHATIYQSTLRNNRANQWGGGITVMGSDATFINCSIIANTTNQEGGAAFGSGGSTMDFLQCTFALNAAPTADGFWFDSYLQQTPGDMTITNSILWDSLDEIRNNDGSSISIGHSNVQGGWAGTGNINADPLFQDLDGPDNVGGTNDDDPRLSAGSPCIDVGDGSTLPADLADLDDDGNLSEPLPVDLDGMTRIAESAVDMGAFERSNLCPPGWWGVSGNQPCTPCPSGSYQPVGGSSACLGCAPGSYGALGAATECQSCPKNTFQPSSGQQSCLPCTCEDGEACTLDTCEPLTGTCANDFVVGCGLKCPAGWVGAEGTEPCAKCNPGTFQLAGGQSECVACPLGTSQPNFGSWACAACGPNTFQPETGQAACLPCGCNDNNFCSLNDCDRITGLCRYEWQSWCEGACPPGWYGVNGLDPCTACPAGTYQVQSGATGCTSCSPGTYQDLTNSIACNSCPSGTYQPGGGAASCLPCPCDDGDPCTTDSCNAVTASCSHQAISNCPTMCGPGTYSANGAMPCASCAPGTYQSTTGATACISCFPGTYQPTAGSNTCLPCGSGRHQPSAGMSSCLACACDDQDSCTQDTCDSVTGACSYAPLVCVIPALGFWGQGVLAMLLVSLATIVMVRRGTTLSGQKQVRTPQRRENWAARART